MDLMRLEIVTPNGVIFDKKVKQVTLPGSEGEFGVLPNHAALVALLDSGIIEIEKEDGSVTAVAINSGYCQVDENKALCVVDGAVPVGEDEDFNAALQEVQKLLESAKAAPTVIAAATSKIERIAKG